MEIKDNRFLRQFEIRIDGHLAKIEYASDDRKVFLTKLEIPEEIIQDGFKEAFIAAVLCHIREKNLSVVPTSIPVKSFVRKYKQQYGAMLPVGIVI